MKLKTNFKVAIAALLAISFSAFATTTPVGFWAARDDDSGKVLSIIQIYKAKDDTYNGRIYKVMDVVVKGKRQSPDDHCAECSGKLANAPMLCMQVIYGMKKAINYPDTWEHGRAYDPKTDNSYHAKMWLADHGATLNLRGYIGLPLFGRTQKWKKVSKPAMSPWVCKRSIANTYHL